MNGYSFCYANITIYKTMPNAFEVKNIPKYDRWRRASVNINRRKFQNCRPRLQSLFWQVHYLYSHLMQRAAKQVQISWSLFNSMKRYPRKLDVPSMIRQNGQRFRCRRRASNFYNPFNQRRKMQHILKRNKLTARRIKAPGLHWKTRIEIHFSFQSLVI